MIEWLIDNWTYIFIGIVFIYSFVFVMCSISYDANEQVENNIVMMRKTSASERDRVIDPQDMGGI